MAGKKTVRIDVLPESAWRYSGYDAIVCVDVLLSATTIVTAVAQGRRVGVAADPARAAELAAGLKEALQLTDGLSSPDDGVRLRGAGGRAAGGGGAAPAPGPRAPGGRRALGGAGAARRRSRDRAARPRLALRGNARGRRPARARVRGVPAQLRGDRQRDRAAAPPRGADRRGRGRRGVRRGPDGDGVARSQDAGPRLRPRGPPHRGRGEALGVVRRVADRPVALGREAARAGARERGGV